MPGNVGFRAFSGMPVFLCLWSGGKYLGMCNERGMGSDPLKGKVFIMAWVGEGRPKFFLDTFLKSPNMPAKFGNFLKKKFFS